MTQVGEFSPPPIVDLIASSTKNRHTSLCFPTCRPGFTLVATSNMQSCCFWLLEHDIFVFFLKLTIKNYFNCNSGLFFVIKFKRLNHIFDVRAKQCLWSVNRGSKTERASPVFVSNYSTLIWIPVWNYIAVLAYQRLSEQDIIWLGVNYLRWAGCWQSHIANISKKKS